MSAQTVRMTFGAMVLGASLLACGGAEVAPPAASPAAKASAAATQAATSTATPPVATAAGGATVRTLGSLKFADRGTASAAGKTELTVAVEDFAFSPTFVQGTPGQKVTLQLTNDTSTPHNLSITTQQVDRDVAAKSKGSVEITIPQSGVLLFFCKFHTAGGMNGELLSGSASPAAVDAPGAPAPGASTPTVPEGY